MGKESNNELSGKKEKRRSFGRLVAAIIAVTLVLGVGVIVLIQIGANHKYKEAEEIINEALSNIEELQVYKAEKKQTQMSDYGLNRSDIYRLVFDGNGSCNEPINEESVDKYIRTVQVDFGDKKENCDIYSVKNMPSDYIVAAKGEEEDIFYGVTNYKYKVKDLESYKESRQLDNSDVSAIFGVGENRVIYNNIDCEYICNTYLAGNEKCIDQYKCKHDESVERLDFRICFEQKATNMSYLMFADKNGAIVIMERDTGMHYEFEFDMDNTTEMLKYIKNNYQGYRCE